VLNSVRGCICAREAGGSRQVYRLSVIAQVSRDIPGLLRSQAALLILLLVIILVTGGVILPAVWSSKKTRRTAALDVLDRLLRWRR
jgi:hypothetical protein